MRRWIIDTDTAGDDAAALILAANSSEVQIEGVTAVFGNVPLPFAERNARMALQIAGAKIPVYLGADRPLLREPMRSESVYGSDGLGDCGLSCPSSPAACGHAVDFIVSKAAEFPDELEILALGPATNLALAIRKSPEIMSRVKRIWSMGTAGFGPGNVTPVAEFNVFCDAEAYRILLESGIPLTVIGFDLCTGDAAFSPEEMAEMGRSCAAGRFLEQATGKLAAYNLRRNGLSQVDLPDAVAAAVGLFDDITAEIGDYYAVCCCGDSAAYGQVILYEPGKEYEGIAPFASGNVQVVRRIHAARFKERFLSRLPGGFF